MTSATLSKKSNADMLAYLQQWYPNLTGIVLNLDGSITVTSSTDFSEGEMDDVLDALLSKKAWDTEIH